MKKYEEASIEIVVLQNSDVITASWNTPDDELEW